MCGDKKLIKKFTLYEKKIANQKNHFKQLDFFKNFS